MIGDDGLDRWSRKYYATRREVEDHKKKGEIVYYEKPCKGGYYLVKPMTTKRKSKELITIEKAIERLRKL